MKDIIEQLKIHEGYKPTVYKCTAGVDTIGVGFAIKDLNLSISTEETSSDTLLILFSNLYHNCAIVSPFVTQGDFTPPV